MGPALEGPVEDGPPGLTVILATDVADESAAVRATVDAVTLALEEIGQAEHVPARVEIEPADDDAPVAD
jgi:hypothetical protein